MATTPDRHLSPIILSLSDLASLCVSITPLIQGQPDTLITTPSRYDLSSEKGITLALAVSSTRLYTSSTLIGRIDMLPLCVYAEVSGSQLIPPIKRQRAVGQGKAVA